ncbi:PREDICTED: putative F-box protein At1g76830 [Camelina sativa]|uniref:F-box protein At1g76830 n=1 Tax=Camelina sativa TaxID=90675 RepID=A0ABM0WJ77_CAMSA|nr:PREDICTED: putative F-box protein At1g76830 [Camelina sativa]
MEGITFESLPQDIKRKILIRMSPNSLVKCISVSKRLATTIRTKSFKELYLRRSMARPRMLFVTIDAKDATTPSAYQVLFRSLHQDQKSGGQRHIISISLQGDFMFSPPVRGLICLQERGKNRVVICNPGTMKFRNLPMVEADKTTKIITQFGYDEGEDEFKVLCTKTKPKTPWENEFQVLTVGVGPGDQEPRRRIVCNVPHTPVRDGVYDRGVLYYRATKSDKSNIIMSFDVSNETFRLIPSPQDVDLNKGFWNFVNYDGKPALVDETNDFVYEPSGGDAYLEMWEFHGYSRWSKNRILIRNWRGYAEDEIKHVYRFRGTTRTKQHVFATIMVNEEGPLVVIYYDTPTETFTRSTVQLLGGGDDEFRFVETFVHHVDSPMLI